MDNESQKPQSQKPEPEPQSQKPQSQLPPTIKDDLAINKFKSLFKLDEYYIHGFSLAIDFTKKDSSGNIISYFKTAEKKIKSIIQ